MILHRRLALALALVMLLALCAPAQVAAEDPAPTPAPVALQGLREMRSRGDLPPSVPGAQPAQPEVAAMADDIASMAQWSTMAWQSGYDGNWEVYVARGDASSPRRLTFDPATDSSPRLNRGATRVAFTSKRTGDYEIYTMNVDGSGLRQLTSVPGTEDQPYWSPDSKRLVFTSTRDGHRQVYVMNADGSGQTRLTFDVHDDIAPSWSPDGTRIAFVRLGDGNLNTLYVMNADGSNQHAITPPLAWAENPVWSPNSGQIGFDYEADGDLFVEVAIVGADGSNRRMVVNESRVESQLVDAVMGAWSPNGAWLTYTRVHYVVQGYYVYLYGISIERYDIGGGYAQHVLDSPAMSPDWQTQDLQAPRARVLALPPLVRAGSMRINWTGEDPGGAGIRWWQVQVKDGLGAPWGIWLPGSNWAYGDYTLVAGHTYGFRAKAFDCSLNLGDFTSDRPDAQTTAYTYQLGGAIRDARGVPVPGATLAISPAPLSPPVSNVTGGYLSYLTGKGDHTLRPEHAGYGQVPVLRSGITADVQIDHYLPPADNALGNSGFEMAVLTSGWQPYGTPAPALNTARLRTGVQSMALGQPVTWSGDDLLTTPGYGSAIAIDSRGWMHVVAGTSDVGHCALWYASKPASSTAPVSPTLVARFDGQYDCLAVLPDDEGGVDVLWIGGNYGYTPLNLWTAHKGAGASTFDPPENPGGKYGWGNLRLARFARDPQGGEHMVFWLQDAVAYAYRPAGGSWQNAEAISSGRGEEPMVVAGPEGTVYAAWNRHVQSNPDVNAVEYRLKPAGGAWGPIQTVASVGSLQRLAVTPDGVLHVVYRQGDGRLAYTHRAQDGSWSTPEPLGLDSERSIKTCELAADSGGRLHLVYLTDKQSVYLMRTPAGEWIRPASGLPVGEPYCLAADGTGHAHVNYVRYDTSAHVVDLHPVLVTAACEAGVRQQVTLPASMHRPTLSLFENLYAGALDEGVMTATVDDGISVTPVITVSRGTGAWQPGWADLSAWAGRTITLTVSWQQQAGQVRGQVLVDDIWLGSWLTPIVQTASPAHAVTGGTIIVTGDNFVQGCSVRLGNVEAPGVEWVDEHTLHVPVPASLGPGVYALWVRNPGGQEGALADAVALGGQTYLPLGTRYWWP